MNYKENLFFIGKCLTISLENKNTKEVKKLIQSDNINWDSIVKVSTAHFVLPALYCNLKRANFLQYLPQELVQYMQYITDLNRERNKKIIEQAKDLNDFLLKNNITAIFLKGTGNLLSGLYDDVGERMIGDIDFLFSKEDYSKAINILTNYGYYDNKKYKYHFPSQKHYRRQIKKNSIAAIEIHKELVLEKYANDFNYNIVKKDNQIINKVCVLSYSNKLNLSIIANEINDRGSFYKKIALRNAYDIYLLSKKTSAKNSVYKFKRLSHILNCFLAACYEVFNRVDSLKYNQSKKTDTYLKIFYFQLDNILKTKKRYKRIRLYLFLKDRMIRIYKAIMIKEYRIWLFRRLTDIDWYREKLTQIGLSR